MTEEEIAAWRVKREYELNMRCLTSLEIERIMEQEERELR